MSWTTREAAVWQEICQMEKRLFAGKGTDLSHAYQRGINIALNTYGGHWSRKMLTKLDDFLFHLQSMIQQGKYDEQTRENLFTQARVFNENIYSITDMKKLSIDQLRFIAKKQLARQRLTAFAQGGLTGAGGILFTLSDLPLLLAINLRTVQLTALTYGYDLHKPYEMMVVLKLFHAISLPPYIRESAWERLLSEVSTIDDDVLFYEGEEDIISDAWMQQPMNQLLKLIVLSFMRKKLVQGIPIFGITAGAGMNYFFAKHVSEMSHLFYQKRWLLEKGKQ